MLGSSVFLHPSSIDFKTTDTKFNDVMTLLSFLNFLHFKFLGPAVFTGRPVRLALLPVVQEDLVS